jgi:hypothetical protein
MHVANLENSLTPEGRVWVGTIGLGLHVVVGLIGKVTTDQIANFAL